MSDKIKCPSCGKEIKATAKFCGFCATKIEAKPVEVRVENNVGSTAESTSAYINPLEGMIPSGGTRGASSAAIGSEISETKKETEKVVESSAGKICTSCGKKMGSRAKFCGVCGGILVSDVSLDTAKEPDVNDMKREVSTGYETGRTEPKTENKNESGIDEMRVNRKIFEKPDAALIDTNPTSVKTTVSTEKIHPDFKQAGEL